MVLFPKVAYEFPTEIEHTYPSFFSSSEIDVTQKRCQTDFIALKQPFAVEVQVQRSRDIFSIEFQCNVHLCAQGNWIRYPLTL